MEENRKQVVLRANYPSLFPLPKLDDKIQKLLLDVLKDRKSFPSQVCFIYNRDIYKHIFLYYLLTLGKFVTFASHNAYYFVDVFLGKFESPKSLYDFDQEVLGVTLGYNETSNIKMIDLIVQLFEIRKSKGLKTLLFFKGSVVDLTTSHKALNKYINDNAVEIINMNRCPGDKNTPITPLTEATKASEIVDKYTSIPLNKKNTDPLVGIVDGKFQNHL